MSSGYSEGGWKLTKDRQELLAVEHPAFEGLLQYMVTAEEPREAAQLYNKHRLELLAMLIPAKQRISQYEESVRVELSIKPAYAGAISGETLEPLDVVTLDGRQFRIRFQRASKTCA